jgi:FkbH-like protein
MSMADPSDLAQPVASPDPSAGVDHMQVMARVRAALKDGQPALALALLRAHARPTDDAVLQGHYARHAGRLAPHFQELPELRVALLADATLGHWVDVLRFWLLLEGFRLEALVVPFGTWRQQVADPAAPLYALRPDVVWFFLHADILQREAEAPVDTVVADLAREVAVVSARLPALLIVNNLVPSAARVYGNLERSLPGTPAHRIDAFNRALPQALPQGAAVFDIGHLAARFGLDRWEDRRLWHHSRHPFALDAQGPVAFAAGRLLAASRGRARKCLVLDLDNTLWGGVVGDDGVDGIRVGPDGGAVGEAFAGFQSWLRALSRRGVALAVCSKNNDALAREPFLLKPGMVLALEDFVVFKANWDNKADNIRAIAHELNLGLDALVFVDDNPAERALVREQLPQVAVPDMPPDPADYIAALDAGAWFETLSVTAEDLSRVQAYRDNLARSQALSGTTDLAAYLQGLDMQARWGGVDAATRARVAQLVNKTNQFQLTNTRYSEAQIQALADAPHAWVGHFSLRDRFGDHGLIAAAVLMFEGDEARIDTWVMSCRVFARQMEHFTFDILCRVARQRQCRRLVGIYRPSAKNGVVADLYRSLGGRPAGPHGDSGTRWEFDLSQAPHGAVHPIQEVPVAA